MKGVKSKAIPFPTERRWVVERVHAIAEHTDRIQWTDHARERMGERDITSRQVLETLRRGRRVRLPQREEGEWKIILEKHHAGRRIHVVARMIVPTMEGEKDELRVVTVW